MSPPDGVMYVVQVKYLAAYLCNLIEFHSNFERFKFRRLSIWLADKHGRHELLSPCYPVYLGSAVQKGHKSMASINFFLLFFLDTALPNLLFFIYQADDGLNGCA